MHAAHLMRRPPIRAAAAAAAPRIQVMAEFEALKFDDDGPRFTLASTGTPPRQRASSSSESPGQLQDPELAEAIVASLNLGFDLNGVDFSGVEGSPERPRPPAGPPPRDPAVPPDAKKACIRIEGGRVISLDGMNIKALEEAQSQLAQLIKAAKLEEIDQKLAALESSLGEQTASVAALEVVAVEASRASDAVVAEIQRLDRLHDEAVEAAKQAAEEARAATEKEAAAKAQAAKANDATQDYKNQHADTLEVSHAAAVKLAEANRLKEEIIAQRAAALEMRASL